MNDGAGTRLRGAFVPALPEAHSRSAWIQNAGGLGWVCLWRWCQMVSRCLTVNISAQKITVTASDCPELCADYLGVI